MNPSRIGLPDRFSAWRPRQYDALWSILQCDTRFLAMVAPTGFGKSLVYIGAALQAGYRVAVLTSTKALQDQLTRDFREAGLFDIRGRNNYVCLLDAGEPHRWARRDHPLTVDEGICNFGVPCTLKASGCTYFDDYRRALKSQLVVTNYSYWLYSYAYGEGLGKFDLLICDEAHDAADQLTGFLAIDLTWGEMRDYGIDDPPEPEPEDCLQAWASWATPHALRIEYEADKLSGRLGLSSANNRSALREAKHLKLLSQRLYRISTLKGEWVLDRTDRGYRWDPLWPRDYAESSLFIGVPQVVLVSATIRTKTMDILGVVDPAHRTFSEYPSSFPVSRRPVYVVPSVRLNAGSSPYDLERWMAVNDSIVGPRLDRKGLFHTVSYQRRDHVLAYSKHRAHLTTHGREETAGVVAKFKVDSRPQVLVSPCLTTGYDFPYQECEFAIISKIAFPSMGSKVVKARIESDRTWMSYVAMMDLVQAAGRGMRAADDRCEVFITDEAVKFLFARHREYAPRWFRESLRWIKDGSPLPAPAPRLLGPH